MQRIMFTLTLIMMLTGCDAVEYQNEATLGPHPAADESYYTRDIPSATVGMGSGAGGSGEGSLKLIDDSQSFITTVAAEDLDDAASVQRKIIYTADMTIVVKNFDGIQAQVYALIEATGGYRASETINSNTGYSRSGTWVARVPVEAYDQFLADLAELGVPESIRQATSDVTTQYIDVEARLVTKRELETRIRELVAEREGEIADVMEAERELARVRGEIESLEGELRYLANQTALSTVTINIREQRDYEPPQAPSFGGRIAHTWSTSLVNLSKFGQGLTLAAVGSAPWLAVMFIVLLPFGILWRNRRKRKAARK